MALTTIFGLQFLLSLLVFLLIAIWYVRPWLNARPLNDALTLLLLPHTLRHMGLSFLVPGLVRDGLPQSFALPAAFGDLAAGLLALAALVALRYRLGVARLLVGIFSVVGLADLINALRQAEAVPHFLAAWYIPTFWVPVLLVSHVLIIIRLWRPESSHGAPRFRQGVRHS